MGRSSLSRARALGFGFIGLVVIATAWYALAPGSTSSHDSHAAAVATPIRAESIGALETPPTDAEPTRDLAVHDAAGEPTHGADGPAAEFPTVEAVAQQFWGPRWEEMKPKLAARIDLGMRADIPLPPWETVRPLVCARLKLDEPRLRVLRSTYRLPQPLTLDYVAKHFQMPKGYAVTEHHVEAIDALLTEVRVDSERALADYQFAIDGALARRCAAGRYDFMPFADIETPNTPEKAVFVTSFALDGWVISCGLAAEETPGMAEAELALKSAKRKSTDIIGAYLRELR